jgi:hypothetical protein
MNYKLLKIGIVLLLVSAYISFYPHVQAQTLPFIQPSPTRIFPIFPSSLICLKATEGQGPSWAGIEIGKTTLSEIKRTPLKINNREITEEITEMYDETHFRWQLADGQVIYVDVCLRDEVVTAAHFSLFSLQETWRMEDFVALYGLPDAVGYAELWRIAFWFEYGMALEIATISDDMLDFNKAIGVGLVLFPIQDKAGYETRWPYLYTPKGIPFVSGLSDEYFELPQNPFDFDAMVATITAESWRTRIPNPMHPLPPTSTAVP